MQPLHSEPNPYETPGIERLHHISVYKWPLPADKRFVFSVNNDSDQVSKCIQASNRVGTSQFAALFVAISLAITLLIWAGTSFSDFTMLLVNVFVFASLCFAILRSTERWHVKRFGKQFRWLLGQVQIEINSDGVRWRSRSIEMFQHWDSFHSVIWGSSCVWLSTTNPFAIELPIHRDWVDESTWRELREVLQTHTAFHDRVDFWKYSRRRPVVYGGAAAPDLEQPGEECIPFRGRSAEIRYACETTTRLLQYAPYLPMVVVPLVFSGMLIPAVEEWANHFFKGWKVSHTIFLIYAFAICQNLFQMGVRWFPAGIGFHQWTQTLISSQSGFVSHEKICIASPACTMTATLDSDASVRLKESYMVLDLQRRFNQSLVIPRDQFSEADAAKVWDMFQPAKARSDS